MLGFTSREAAEILDVTESQLTVGESFTVQRRHGIDPGRAPGRDVAGEESSDQEQTCDPAQRRWIDGTDSVQLAGKEPAEGQGADETDSGPGSRQAQPSCDDELEDVDRIGAHRHADADLAHALAYRESDHTIDADRGQQQRTGGEAAEQDR